MITEQFRQAMQSAGIAYYGEIIADGQLHRCHIDGQKSGSKNGAYKLHNDNRPAGWFMDFVTGVSQTWCSGSSSPVSIAMKRQIAEAKKQHEAEQRRKHEATARRANYIWGKCVSADDHPYLQTYLQKKRIKANGARLHPSFLPGNRATVVIPLQDEDGNIVNLQFISPEGSKRFQAGGRKKGCSFTIGALTQKILICEGFATGASLYQDSGLTVIVAFDAGNLLPVAKTVRALSAPDTEIIICGDNDLSGAGQNKANAAALAVKGKILIPTTPGNDWNDEITRGAN